MKCKLLCVDVDGTLACDDKSISDKNIETLKKVHDKGIRIAIASGRTPNSLNEIFERIGIPALLICLNGAYLQVARKTIAKHSLSFDQLEKAYQIIVNNQTTAAFSTPEFSIRNSDISSSWKKQLEKGSLKADFIIAKNRDDYRDLIFKYAKDIVKISILEKNLEKYLKIRNEFEAWGTFEVAMSDTDYIDITDLEVTKGMAIKELSSYLNIELSEVICIGDNENDLAMLNEAGLSVAMKNAVPAVKEIADIISDEDNNHHGVADVIEKYIL